MYIINTLNKENLLADSIKNNCFIDSLKAINYLLKLGMEMVENDGPTYPTSRLYKINEDGTMKLLHTFRNDGVTYKDCSYYSAFGDIQKNAPYIYVNEKNNEN